MRCQGQVSEINQLVCDALEDDIKLTDNERQFAKFITNPFDFRLKADPLGGKWHVITTKVNAILSIANTTLSSGYLTVRGFALDNKLTILYGAKDVDWLTTNGTPDTYVSTYQSTTDYNIMKELMPAGAEARLLHAALRVFEIARPTAVGHRNMQLVGGAHSRVGGLYYNGAANVWNAYWSVARHMDALYPSAAGIQVCSYLDDQCWEPFESGNYAYTVVTPTASTELDTVPRMPVVSVLADVGTQFAIDATVTYSVRAAYGDGLAPFQQREEVDLEDTNLQQIARYYNYHNRPTRLF